MHVLASVRAASPRKHARVWDKTHDLRLTLAFDSFHLPSLHLLSMLLLPLSAVFVLWRLVAKSADRHTARLRT
jgi:hypothetical protein